MTDPARFPHYSVIERLGAGGMAEVYLARDDRLPRNVALKVVRADLLSDTSLLARLQQEAKLAAALNHPNICTVYELGTTEDGLPFVALEYVPHTDLFEVLQTRSLAVEEVVSIGLQTCNALVVAHQHGVIHRDIKPANLMMSDQGWIKVLDFGLARIYEPGKIDLGSGAPRQPSEHGVHGTVAYMSPEQIRGEILDPRTDLFSLGVTLYELVTGTLPFSGESWVDLARAICEQEPDPPSAKNSSIPKAFDEAVLRALQKDRADRYETAEMMQRALSMLGPEFQVHNVAVLPFSGSDENDSAQAFRDGLVEQLTRELDQLNRETMEFQVLPERDVLGKGIESPAEAHRDLGGSLVIRGEVRRLDGEWQLRLDLVHAKTKEVVASREVAGTKRLGRDFQKELAREAVDLLRSGRVRSAAVGTIEDESPSSHPTKRRESSAYELYLTGRGNLIRFEVPERLEAAICSFSQAIGLDDEFALAHCGLAECYCRKFQRTRDPKWIELAQLHGDRALELDEGFAETHVTLGMVSRASGAHEDAIRHYRRALEIDSTFASACQELARCNEELGRLGETEAALRRAVELRPTYWGGYLNLGAFYYDRGLFDEAESAFLRVTTLLPDGAWGFNNLASLYFATDRYTQARAMYERSFQINPNTNTARNLGVVDSASGDLVSAVSWFETSVKLSDRNHRAWSYLGTALSRLDDSVRSREAFLRAAALAEEEIQTNPRNAEILGELAAIYSEIEDRKKTIDAIERMQFAAPPSPGTMFVTGYAFEKIGERDSALRWLSLAVAGGLPKSEIDREPGLADLRMDRRYLEGSWERIENGTNKKGGS